MEGFALAIIGLTGLALYAWHKWRKTPEYTDGKPKDCTCLWVQSYSGPYRALPDMYCRARHEGM